MPKSRTRKPKHKALRTQTRFQPTVWLGEHEHPLPPPLAPRDSPDTVLMRHVGNRLALCGECSARTLAEMRSVTPSQLESAVAQFCGIMVLSVGRSSNPKLVAEKIREAMPPAVAALVDATDRPTDAEADAALRNEVARLSDYERSTALVDCAELAAVMLAGSTGAWTGGYDEAINTPLFDPGQT